MSSRSQVIYEDNQIKLIFNRSRLIEVLFLYLLFCFILPIIILSVLLSIDPQEFMNLFLIAAGCLIILLLIDFFFFYLDFFITHFKFFRLNQIRFSFLLFVKIIDVANDSKRKNFTKTIIRNKPKVPFLIKFTRKDNKKETKDLLLEFQNMFIKKIYREISSISSIYLPLGDVLDCNILGKEFSVSIKSFHYNMTKILGNNTITIHIKDFNLLEALIKKGKNQLEDRA